MASSKSFFLFICAVCTLTVARSDSSVPCYKLEPGVLAGIVSADVLLTLILVTITYRCASIQHRKNNKHREKNDHNLYMNVRASKKI